MKKRANYLLGIIAISFSITTSAQDLHFSQYYNSPLLVNPANTGFIPEGAYRFGINYRKQWANLSPYPYKTFSAFGDAQVFANRFENGWMGIGGALLRDVAGTGQLSTTRAFASVAYHQQLGLASLFSAGFNIGWVQKRIDFSKLTFDNQWNGKFFDITLPNNEAFIKSQVNYFDLQAGVNYAYYPSEDAYVNIGISASHINRPKESFFSPGLVDTRIPMRLTAFANGSFRYNDVWILNPNVYVSRMTTAWEIVFGGIAQRSLSPEGTTQLLLGGYYRVQDAFVPVIGFQQSGYKLTFSYDITSSYLQKFNQSRGAYELSLIKQGLFNEDQPLKCPSVRF